MMLARVAKHLGNQDQVKAFATYGLAIANKMAREPRRVLKGLLAE